MNKDELPQFTFSDVSNRSGEVLEKALQVGVTLTKHGRSKLVVVPVDRFTIVPNAEYARLTNRLREGAYAAETAPQDLRDSVLKTMAAILDEPDAV
jgi:prevent-host-death family protein